MLIDMLLLLLEFAKKLWKTEEAPKVPDAASGKKVFGGMLRPNIRETKSCVAVADPRKSTQRSK